MADERYTFEQARLRLEEIAAEVRKKDTSLEKSLELLEEGVRLANICTDLVDHTDIGATVAAAAALEATQNDEQGGPVDAQQGEPVADGDAESAEDVPDASSEEFADDERD